MPFSKQMLCYGSIMLNVEIGGQEIDKHMENGYIYGHNLTHNKDKSSIVRNGSRNCYGLIYFGIFFCTTSIWFCRNPGLALPLIALQYHEVKFHIDFSNHAKVGVNGGTLDEL